MSNTSTSTVSLWYFSLFSEEIIARKALLGDCIKLEACDIFFSRTLKMCSCCCISKIRHHMHTVHSVPRSPPVCVSWTRDPRWAIATNAGPFLSPSHGRALCHGSACVRTRPLAPLHSAPCLQSHGGGDGGGGAYGLWTCRDLCHDPCLWTWCHLIGWLCSRLCPDLMVEFTGVTTGVTCGEKTKDCYDLG